MPEAYGGVEAVYKTMYQENVQLALQQKESRLEQSFSFIPNMSGKDLQAVELVGPSTARRNAPGNAPTPNIQPSHKGIFVKPERLDWGRSIPTETSVKAAVDYQSTYVQEGAAAIRRGKDEILNDAILGPRFIKTDEDGLPQAVAFDTVNQQVGVNVGGATSGLNVAKILAVFEKWIAAEVDVDNEQLFALITAKENTALYNQLQVTSKDYRNKAVFEEKRIVQFMGINFITYNRPKVDGSSYRRIPFYVKSGMHYGDPVPVTTRIERNPGMQYQLHPYMEHWAGATRSEDAKVVEVLCAG